MTIRRRLAVAAAVAVAIAIAVASLAAYLAVRSELRGQVDSTLLERARGIQMIARSRRPLGVPPNKLRLPKPPQARFGGAEGVVQFLTPAGKVRRPLERGTVRLPLTPQARALATGDGGGMLLQDQTVAGSHLRVLTEGLKSGGAVQVARPLGEVDSVLHELLLILAGVTAGGIGLAALLGALVSRASLAPVRRFTAETESIVTGPDLSRRLPEGGDDELGRLARSYNATLAALQRSADAQRRMVSDASHELRTPLASVKANIELLLRGEERLPARDREELERDLVEQIDDLTLLGTTSSSWRGAASPSDSPTTSTWRRSPRRRSSGPLATRRASASRRISSPARSAGSPSGSPARSTTCSTTPPSGAPRAAWSR